VVLVHTDRIEAEFLGIDERVDVACVLLGANPSPHLEIRPARSTSFSMCDLPHIPKSCSELFLPSLDGWAVHMSDLGRKASSTAATVTHSYVARGNPDGPDACIRK
jgi:hypothetical protein